MNPTHRPIRRLAAKALALATIVCGSLGVPGSVDAWSATDTETAVMAFVDDVSPAVTVDRSTNCMPGATVGATQSTDAVAYRNDRIVLRTTASTNSVTTTINATLHTMYGNNLPYVGPIETITFPTPPGGPAIVPVLSVTLLPRPGGLQHDILGLARHLRNDSGKIASPDYTNNFDGPYGHYFPYGFPQNTSSLTPPRTNLTGAGLKIGTGTKIEVYDSGMFALDPVNLPTATQLTSADNDLVNLVNNGPKEVDFPEAGHDQGIVGVLTTIAPGATIESVRVNDRAGLLTDVSAARAIASSLRTLSLTNYPNLLINAFGTAACNLNPAAVGGAVLQPIGTEAIVEVVDKFDPFKAGGMLIVASAGNEATTRPHYPAAFPSVLSVGALDGTVDSDLSPWSSPSKNAPIAEFSNRGSTVDVYALGVELPTTHVNGYRFEAGADLIMGKALVSGTSFAAPKMAAYVSEVMSTNGLRARAARDLLIAGGIAPLPQCGTTTIEQGKAVVLSALTASITAPPIPANPITC
jgi:hypothetical protein